YVYINGRKRSQDCAVDVLQPAYVRWARRPARNQEMSGSLNRVADSTGHCFEHGGNNFLAVTGTVWHIAESANHPAAVNWRQACTISMRNHIVSEGSSIGT